MPLRGVELTEVPEETARVARAVFPKGCLAMRVRDVLGPVFADTDFKELFPVHGRPAVSPARLALAVHVADGTATTTSLRLFITLLDHRRYPAAELAELYHRRWQADVAASIRYALLGGSGAE